VLATDDSGNLFAGGEFDTAGGIGANHIAKWNGNTWYALESGTNNIIHTITVDELGNIYAGGEFDNAGGVNANHIAKWNGNSWDALGSGTDDWVYALAIDDSNNIYAGGSFSFAGGKISTHIAQCKLKGLTDVLQRKGDKISKFFTNYNACTGTIKFQLKDQAQVSYRIFSLSGRQIYQASENMCAGSHSMRINTGRAARGMYIVNFKAGNESMRFRLVVEK
jgi:hypothetical protein